MSLGEWISAGVGTAGIGSLVVSLIRARPANRKLRAEASHLGVEDVKVLVADTAMGLMRTLKLELAEAEQECKDLKARIKEMSSEVEQLRAELEEERRVSNKTVAEMNAANRRADYYQGLLERNAQRGPEERP